MKSHETHLQSQTKAGIDIKQPPLNPTQLGALKYRHECEIAKSQMEYQRQQSLSFNNRVKYFVYQ